MPIKALSLVAFFAFFQNFPASADRAIPVDAFPDRFQRATIVVLGEVIKIEDPKSVAFDYFKLSPGSVRKVTLKPKKFWKGKVSGNVEFYYLPFKNEFESESLTDLSKTSSELSKGYSVLLYLSKVEDKFVASTGQGIRIHTGDGGPKLEEKPEFKALDLILKGKMEEAKKICRFKC